MLKHKFDLLDNDFLIIIVIKNNKNDKNNYLRKSIRRIYMIKWKNLKILKIYNKII